MVRQSSACFHAPTMLAQRKEPCAIFWATMCGQSKEFACEHVHHQTNWQLKFGLKKLTDKPVAPIHLLIGSGGTFTALAIVCYDLGNPFRGSYQISKSVHQLYTIRMTLRASLQQDLQQKEETAVLTTAAETNGTQGKRSGTARTRFRFRPVCRQHTRASYL